MTSSQSSLTARFQRRLESERVEIEATAARQLKVLGESLRGVAENALSTTEADTAAWIERVRAMFLRAWLWPLMFGLMLSAGICGGSWAGTRWLWTTIEQQIEALTVLRVDIEEARVTLARIEDTTWGLELKEIEGERFVVLPAGALSNPPWTVGGRPALKLPAE
jgi:hypothetical protein